MTDNPHARHAWDVGALHDITPDYFYLHSDDLHLWIIQMRITGSVISNGPKDPPNGLIPAMLPILYTSAFIHDAFSDHHE